MKSLGIDPGLARVGIGLVEKDRTPSSDVRILDWCTVETAKGLPLPQRLKELAQDIRVLLNEYRPDIVVVEKLYFETNVKTAIDVAQARGVILLTAEESGIPVLEPTPLELKVAVTGDGRADKRQMQDMLVRMFGEECASDDAADAVGLALYGVFCSKEMLLTGP